MNTTRPRTATARARTRTGPGTVARAAVPVLLAAVLPACSLLGFGGGGESDTGRAPPAGAADDAQAGGPAEGGAAQAEAVLRAEAALTAAREASLGGDALAALSIATRALRQGVPAEYEAPLRELRAQAREALLGGQVLRLTVLPERDAVTDGDPVRVHVDLRNLAAAPLRVPVEEQDSSPSQFVLEVLREDFDVYGNVRTTEFVERVPLEHDLDLAPGATGRLLVEIPPERSVLGHVGFSVLHVGGHLRPVAVRLGATEFFDAIPLEGALVRVFMQGYEPLAARPLASLREAVKRRSPPHILTAAELLAPEERAGAAEFLERAAQEDPPLAFACRAAAARLRQAQAR